MFRLRQHHQHVSGVYPSNHIILYYNNGGHRKNIKKIFLSKLFANEVSCRTTKHQVHINNKHTCGQYARYCSTLTSIHHHRTIRTIKKLIHAQNHFNEQVVIELVFINFFHMKKSTWIINYSSMYISNK